jgi:hypothetical protein
MAVKSLKTKYHFKLIKYYCYLHHTKNNFQKRAQTHSQQTVEYVESYSFINALEHYICIHWRLSISSYPKSEEKKKNIFVNKTLNVITHGNVSFLKKFPHIAFSFR